MEDNWKGIKETLTSTYQEVMGHNKHHHKEWVCVETLYKIQERKDRKIAINKNYRTRVQGIKAQAEYSEANRQVKMSNRADKQKYEKSIATTVEKAVSAGNIKQRYDTTKKLSKCENYRVITYDS